MANTNLTFERANELIEYNPETGLYRVKKLRKGVKNLDWTSGSIGSHGYNVVGIDRKTYTVHRLAYLLMKGNFPEKEIDHINGIRTDNRWSNLREATRSDNIMNRKINKNNTSGTKGIYFIENLNKWRARIMVNGKQLHLGVFDNQEDAKNAYKNAEILKNPEYIRE